MIEQFDGTEGSAGVILTGQRLGKLPPRYDRRTLQLARYIERRKLPKIPQTHTLSKKTIASFPEIGVMANDRYGDCTIAALGHSFQSWTVYGKKPWRPTDGQIIEAYFKINGGSDNGAFMLDALNLAREEGIGGNKIHAYVAINPLNHDQVRTAHLLFGNVYFGANLPITARDQNTLGRTWEIVEGNGSAPGSWGGHAMNLWDTSRTGGALPTWGRMQKFTWEWWDRYVDEAYTILEEDYLGDDRRSPQGFSLKKLSADIKAL